MHPIRNQLQVLIAEPQAAMADALTALVESVGNSRGHGLRSDRGRGSGGRVEGRP